MKVNAPEKLLVLKIAKSAGGRDKSGFAYTVLDFRLWHLPTRRLMAVNKEVRRSSAVNFFLNG